MKERGKGGSIVNISSILSGKLVQNGQCVYSGTKAAVERLTTSAAHELGQYQVEYLIEKWRAFLGIFRVLITVSINAIR